MCNSRITYHKVISREEAVLVDVHDAESLLELLDGRVGEGVENVGLLGHLDVFVMFLRRAKDEQQLKIVMIGG